MSEKRFTLEQWTEESLYFSDGEYSAHMSIGYICKKVEKKLNEQQATITAQNKGLDEYRDNIIALSKENEKLRQQLKEKEEDEQLYANEIVKLNKEAKEVLDFKSLGGDY